VLVRRDECGLVSALTSYRKQWDDARKCYKSVPYHDWASNYADAFRQWSQGYTAQGAGNTFTRPGVVPGVTQVRREPVHVIGDRRVGY